MLHALDTGSYVEPSNLLVRDYMQQWLDTMRGQVSPKSHERYEEIVNGFIAPALGSHKLTRLMPGHIQAAYSDWEKGGRRDGKGGGLSARTRLHIHRILNSALKAAVKIQILARNPAEAVNAPKPTRKDISALDAAQSVQLLTAIRQTRMYVPVLLALATGMRRGEIMALRWKHVDFDKKAVRVVESLEQTRKGLRFKPPKNDKVRVVSLPAYAVEELQRHKADQTEAFLKLGIALDGNTLVYSHYDGSPILPNSLTHQFRRFVRNMKNFPAICFHDLRHTHATELLRSGIHPKVAQERLGHSSISVTFDIYSHVTETMQADAAAKIDAVLRGVG